MCRLFGVLVIILCCASRPFAEMRPVRLQAVPEVCGSSVFYDIDGDGNLVKADAVSDSQHVVGHIPVSTNEMESATGGFYDLEGTYACLFFPSTEKKVDHDVYVRLWLSDLALNQTTATSILLDRRGDWAVFPVQRDKIYVQYDTTPRRVVRLIYDPTMNRVSGSFEFDLRKKSFLSLSNDGDHLYLAHPYTSYVQDIDAHTDKEIARYSFDSLEGQVHDKRAVFIVALTNHYALILWKYQSEKEMKLWLYNLEDGSVVAESQRINYTYGRFLIAPYTTSPERIRLVSLDVVNGSYRLTGDIQIFAVEGGNVIEEDSFTFDPSTEIPVLDSKTQQLVLYEEGVRKGATDEFKNQGKKTDKSSTPR